MQIKSLHAYQIFDSRGVPTIEAEVILANGLTGRGTVPSGASTGQYEALELRDKDPKSFRGKSVFKAIANVNGEVAKLLVGSNVLDQPGIDRKADRLRRHNEQIAARGRMPFSPHQWPARMRPPRRGACRSMSRLATMKARCCRCRRFRSSVAARTRIGGPMCRTFCSSPTVRRPTTKSCRSRTTCFMPPAT